VNHQSRIKNTSKNIVFAIIFQFIKILLVFLGRIIFVRQLGVSYLGINGLFTNVLSILSLADFGITTTLMFCLYKPLSDNDEEKIVQYMNYFKKVYNVIALAVAIFGICLMPFLKYLVNLPDNVPNIYIYYLLLLGNSVLSYLFVYKTTLLSADQKMYVINKYDIVFQFILFFVQNAFLILTKSFILYLVCNIVCTFISNLLKVNATNKIYPFLKEKIKLELPKDDKRNIFKNLYSLSCYKLGSVLQGSTDNILISVFVGTIAVGYYSNYNTIILSVTSFLTLAFSALKASMGNFVITKDKIEQFKMYNILEVYNYWLVSFCSVCFMILIPDFLEICFGKEYILGFGLLVCTVLNFYTSNIRQVLWVYRETTGIFTKTKYITLVTTLFNVILSIIGGYCFGITGIILATIVARFIYAWWREVQIIFKNCFDANPDDYYITYIKRLIGTCIIYFITALICKYLTVFNIYISFVIKMIVCVIVPNVILFIVYRNSIAINYFKSDIIKMIINKKKSNVN